MTTNRHQAAYRAALELVARIDEDLTRQVGHYYTKSGRLLTTLDEVTRAILTDNLLTPEEASDSDHHFFEPALPLPPAPVLPLATGNGTAG